MLWLEVGQSSVLAQIQQRTCTGHCVRDIIKGYPHGCPIKKHKFVKAIFQEIDQIWKCCQVLMERSSSLLGDPNKCMHKPKQRVSVLMERWKKIENYIQVCTPGGTLLPPRWAIDSCCSVFSSPWSLEGRISFWPSTRIPEFLERSLRLVFCCTPYISKKKWYSVVFCFFFLERHHK